MPSPFTKWGKPSAVASDKQNASRLATYLTTADSQQAEHLLTALAAEHIQPTVLNVLRQRHLTSDEIASLLGGVVGTLIEQLRKEREQQQAHTATIPRIANLEGYVAVVTHHAVDAALRQQSPERARLRRGLRYILLHSPHYGIWEQDGMVVAGRREMLPRRHAIAVLTAEELARQCVISGNPHVISLVLLTEALLHAANAPIVLETLIDAAGIVRGIATQPVRLQSEPLSASRTALEQALLNKETLSRIWQEVRQLPARQSAALLLNLRDHEGRGVLELLLALGITDREGIATAMEWTMAELERVWDLLPVDDNQIARWLGATRQQVINLRKVARERLERRMRRIEGESE